MGIELITSISQYTPSRTNPNPDRVIEGARRAEAAGFDTALVGYGSSQADGWMTAAQALFHTSTFCILLAHRPGFMMPTVAARLASTLDIYSRGRIHLNIVTGGSDKDQVRDGDFTDHDTRYVRSIEYLDVMKRVWTSTEPFDFTGRFYRVEGGFHNIAPVQVPHPKIYLGGASEAAKPFAARHADVYMSWSEPVGDVRERFDEMRGLCHAVGRPSPGFSVSMRLIIGKTEDEAWALTKTLVPPPAERRPVRFHSGDEGRNRQLALATKSEVHDERLWMGIAAATGGQGSTGALVGTGDQIIESLLRYVEAGATSLLLTGPSGAYEDLPPGLLAELRRQADRIIDSSPGPSRDSVTASS